MTIVMKASSIPAGIFKARCLAILDEVARTGRAVVVTKRGKPVARVVSIAGPPSLRGSVRSNVSDDELIGPIEERWGAEAE
ncbi:MAG: type II toxin-antitoxin system Phd/YefM family antitoxin [Candidatus Limnocylindria bacterium]